MPESKTAPEAEHQIENDTETNVSNESAAGALDVQLTLPDAVDFLGAVDVKVKVGAAPEKSGNTAGTEEKAATEASPEPVSPAPSEPPRTVASAAAAAAVNSTSESAQSVAAAAAAGAASAAAGARAPAQDGPKSLSVVLTVDGGESVATIGGSFVQGEGGLQAVLAEGRGEATAQLRAMRSGSLRVSAQLHDDSGPVSGSQREAQLEVAEPSVEWSAELVRRVGGSGEARRSAGQDELLLIGARNDPELTDSIDLRANLGRVDEEGLAHVTGDLHIWGLGPGQVEFGMKMRSGQQFESSVNPVSKGAFDQTTSWGINREHAETTSTRDQGGGVLEPVSGSGETSFTLPATFAKTKVENALQSAQGLLTSIGDILETREAFASVKKALEGHVAAQNGALNPSNSLLGSVVSALTLITKFATPIEAGVETIKILNNALFNGGLVSGAASLVSTGAGLSSLAGAADKAQKAFGGIPNAGAVSSTTTESVLGSQIEATLSAVDTIANTHVNTQANATAQHLAEAQTMLDELQRHFGKSLSDGFYLGLPAKGKLDQEVDETDAARIRTLQVLEQSKAIWTAFASTGSNTMGNNQRARSIFDVVARWKSSDVAEEREYFKSLSVYMVERQKCINFTGETSAEFETRQANSRRYRLGHAYVLAKDTVSDAKASLWITGPSAQAIRRAMVKEVGDKVLGETRDERRVQIDLNAAHALKNLGVGTFKNNDDAQVQYQFRGQTDPEMTARDDEARLEGIEDWERTLQFKRFATKHLGLYSRIFRIDKRDRNHRVVQIVRGSGYDVIYSGGANVYKNSEFGSRWAPGERDGTLMRQGVFRYGANPMDAEYY